MSGSPYEPAAHYDRVTAAWSIVLGDDLHYGVFESAGETLETATARLTALLLDAARVGAGSRVLDVGCGTGAPACRLAAEGAIVTGISTSPVGIERARERVRRAGLGDRVELDVRDGTDNGFPDASFDVAWVLESSHLMPRRDRLVSECARVLRPGGRLVLCDIVRRRELPVLEVRRLLEPFLLLREVFGEARMDPLDSYAALAENAGLRVGELRDLTAATRPTFDRWRERLRERHDEVSAMLGETGARRFAEACDVLARFWDDGTLGYGLLAAVRA